jgi:hypothetical protein
MKPRITRIARIIDHGIAEQSFPGSASFRRWIAPAPHPAAEHPKESSPAPTGSGREKIRWFDSIEIFPPGKF